MSREAATAAVTDFAISDLGFTRFSVNIMSSVSTTGIAMQNICCEYAVAAYKYAIMFREYKQYE